MWPTPGHVHADCLPLTTTARISRRCGLEASTYRAVQTAVPIAEATSAHVDVGPPAVERLRGAAQGLADS